MKKLSLSLLMATALCAQVNTPTYSGIMKATSGSNTTSKATSGTYSSANDYVAGSFTSHITGAVTMPAVKALDLEVPAEFFGCVANGSTNNDSCLTKVASYLAGGGGRKVKFTCADGNQYLYQTTWNLSAVSYASIEGNGPSCELFFSPSATQSAAVNLVGAEAIDFRNIDFYSNQFSSSPPGAVLVLGRPSRSVQSGQFKFNSVRVEGYATKAMVYSIGSEENTWLEPTIFINSPSGSAGAQYAFYTSYEDDLSIGITIYSDPSASNLSLWMQNFHIADFASSGVTTSSSLIYDGGNASQTGNHTFRDGYMAIGGGTGITFSAPSGATGWMGLTVDSVRFEGVYQAVYFAGSGSFGDVSITNNKTSGFSPAPTYLVNLPSPSSCYDCTFRGNNIDQGNVGTTISSFYNLSNSEVSEGYAFTVSNSNSSVINNRSNGSLQIGTTNAQPSCSSTIEGTLWYKKGVGTFQICQYSGGSYAWVTH